jgi:GDP-4-dehydro-6-deoxy-D-mannose reductase
MTVFLRQRHEQHGHSLAFAFTRIYSHLPKTHSMKALLTGAGGFSGQAMTRFLAAQGVETYSIGAHALSPSVSPRHTPSHTPRHTQLDITSAEQIESALQAIEPDYVFHLAGVVRSPDPQLFYRVNTAFAVALFSAAESIHKKTAKPLPILCVGTAAELGQPRPDQLPIREDMPPKPLEHYGISKLTQTHVALAAHARAGLPVVVARPSNIIGAGMPQHFVVQSFATQIAAMMRDEQSNHRQTATQIATQITAPRRNTLRTGNLASARDFISIGDVVQAYWQLLNTPAAFGELVNVCSGVATPIASIVEQLTSLASAAVPTLAIDIETDPALVRPVDVLVHYGSTEKFQSLVGVPPAHTPLEAVLEEILYAS